MSTSALDISADDPRFTEEIQQTGIPTGAGPLERRMYDLDLEDKLKRLFYCEEFSKYYKCTAGHVHCRNSSRCDLHYACARCAEWEAHERTQKYAPLEQFMPSKFICATITSPDPASGESIRKLERQFSRLARTLKGDFPTRNRLIFQLHPSADRTPEVRIIYGRADITAENFASAVRKLFPGHKVTATTHLKNEFIRCLDNLDAPIKLKYDDPYRADVESMFESIRAFHVLGFSRVELGVCKPKKPDTSNSTENGEAHPENSHRKCPTCGQPLILSSRWYRRAYLPKLEEVEFRDPREVFVQRT